MLYLACFSPIIEDSRVLTVIRFGAAALAAPADSSSEKAVEVSYGEKATETPERAESFAEMRKLYAEGKLNMDTMCWVEGWENWKPLSDCTTEFGIDVSSWAQIEEVSKPVAEGTDVEVTTTYQAGWISKKGARRRNWERRYFVVGGGFLMYFQSPTHYLNANPKNVLWLQVGRPMTCMPGYFEVIIPIP